MWSILTRSSRIRQKSLYGYRMSGTTRTAARLTTRGARSGCSLICSTIPEIRDSTAAATISPNARLSAETCQGRMLRAWSIQPSCAAEGSECRLDFCRTRYSAPIRFINRLDMRAGSGIGPADPIGPSNGLITEQRAARIRAARIRSRLPMICYQRLPQLQPPPKRPLPRTSLMTSRSISAPIVALMIAATIPMPR
jgi:hypothetical protein